jgi:hypothetical protein
LYIFIRICNLRLKNRLILCKMIVLSFSLLLFAFLVIIILIQEHYANFHSMSRGVSYLQVQVGSRIIGYSPEYVPRVWILEWRLGHAVSSNVLEPAQVFCHISLSALQYLDGWASSLLSMSYKPQAQFYYSCRTVKDTFGIERDEILPGWLQI